MCDHMLHKVSYLTQPHCKNIRRFYGKITGNQLPVHFPLLFTGTHKHFQESGTEQKQRTLLFFFCHTILQRYFRALSVNITLPYLDKNVLQVNARKNNGVLEELAARCQVFHRKIYGFLQCSTEKIENLSGFFPQKNFQPLLRLLNR